MPDGGRDAQLFVLAGPDLARSFPVGERATLGRADECDVVLRDRSISRKHAVLVRQGERWYVQDLGSTNGVSKDGQRAERIELQDGDEFKLGDLPLRLRVGAVEVADIEFALEAPVPRQAAAPPPRPVAVEVRTAPAEELEEEIEIEGPDEPVRTPMSPTSSAPTTFRPPRSERRTGLLAGDFSQHPSWLQAVIVLGLLVVCAGLAYGAYQAVALLRSGS